MVYRPAALRNRPAPPNDQFSAQEGTGVARRARPGGAPWHGGGPQPAPVGGWISR